MKSLRVNVEGEETSDLEEALEEALRLVRKGFLSGYDEGDTGRFDFRITEEYE